MFHMGWFLGTGFGVYGWNSEWAGNVTQDVGNPDLFVYMAQSLERACVALSATHQKAMAQ